MLPPLTLEQVQEPGSHKAKWNGTLINVIANANICLTISCQNDCCQKVQFCAAHDWASRDEESGGHGQKEGKNPGTTYQITSKKFIFSRVQGVISAKETHTKHWTKH